MRTHAQTSDFFHLQFDEGADHVVSEHVASSQEAAVGIQFPGGDLNQGKEHIVKHFKGGYLLGYI